jgi:hypothetical protein
MSRACLVMLASLVLGCGDDPAPVAAECNPLGTTGCVLPWPSSIYERADASSPTGVRLDLPVGALPVNFEGIEIDPTWINRRTGFSPMTQILLTFPGGVDDSNLVFHDDIAASLTDASPTVILNLATGERVAHFAEVDVNEIDRLDDQILYLRPAARLAGGTRYAVAIRDSLRGKTGPLARSAAFDAMLDRAASGHARLDATRARTAEALDALAAAGIPRDDLVVAFDFTTADDDTLIADALGARDAAMAVVGDGEGVAYTVTATMPAPSPGTARIVRFDYTTPAIADLAGFHRDADRRVIVSGATTTQGSIVIPSCATPSNKAGIVVFGHGFFGGLDESTGTYLRQFAQATCNVVIGGVWRGMSSDEVSDALFAFNDLNRLPGFGERIWQGMVDFMTLTRLARGKLARELLVDAPGSPTPASIVDPDRLLFYGISQGHILGSTLYAYDQVVQRASLGVGGANWAIMFERANSWQAFSLPLKGSYGGLQSSVILQQVIEMGLELVDSATVAPRLLAGGVPGTPAKQWLLHMSVDDCSVPNLASQYQARSIGLPLLAPAVRVPYGLVPSEGPMRDAFVIMDEHPEPRPPTTNELTQCDNVAHENLRRRRATMQQIERFQRTGEIVNFCTGACDCAAGNCGPLP